LFKLTTQKDEKTIHKWNNQTDRSIYDNRPDRHAVLLGEIFMDQNVTTSNPCCLTGSRDGLIVCNKDRHGQDLRTVICRDSGLVFTDPRPTPEQIKRFYSDEYRQSYKGTMTPKPKHVLRAGRLAQERLEEIKDFLKPGSSILDVGSGGGEFVYTCKLNGWDASGIEPNKGYANFSVDEYGIDVDCNFYDEVKFKQESFDTITMFHVLEHLEDPVGSISQLTKFLKTDGTFIVEVPNVEYTDTAPNQKWHVGHLYNFNLQTLQAVGLKAGLEPIRTYFTGFGSSLFTVFRKTDKPQSISMAEMLKGSFENSLEILKRHTTLSHYMHLHVPIRRCVSRIYRTINEKIATRNSGKPREILESLVTAPTV